MILTSARRLLVVAVAAGVLEALVLGAGNPAEVQGLSSIQFKTASLDAAQKHYEGHLGLGFERISKTEARVSVGTAQTVRLVEGLAPDENVRLVEFTLGVNDVKAMRAKLLKAKLRPSPIQAGSFTLRDPDGTLIRFEAPGAARTPSSSAISAHLEHIGVLVERKNLAAAEHFYHEVLGFPEYWRYSPRDVLTLVKYRIPGPRPDILELMIHDGNPTRQRIGSMNHINLAVTDIHHTHRTLVSRGAKAPQPRVNAEDLWAMNLFDPDGTRTEIQVISKIPQAAIREEKIHGRDAWVLSNGWMRVGILRGGGHIAEVRLTTGDAQRDLNPMRVPHYPTIDPNTYDDAKHNATYGDDPHRWLSAGYMGHLLCFPWYGPPSSETEIKAGLGNHGEAPVVAWKEVKREVTEAGVTFEYAAELLKSHFRVERKVTLPRGLRQVRVEEWVENLLDQDRPVNWMQHATFGPPFIEPGKSVMRISAAKAAGDDEPLKERVMPATPKSGKYTALLMDAKRGSQFFTLRHSERPLTIGYVYPTDPAGLWVGDWQENGRITGKPWNGQAVARGIEFGSTPYAEGLKKSIERGSLLETPAFRWIGARERAKTEFTIFLTESDPKDVRLVDGIVELTP